MTARSLIPRCVACARVVLVVLLGIHALPQPVQAEETTSDVSERIAWRRSPIAVELSVGTERLVHFPEAVRIGVPAEIQNALRIQSVAGTIYLLAHQAFGSTRVIARGVDNGEVYLLDLSAVADGQAGPAIEIVRPDDPRPNDDPATTDPAGLPRYGYVALTRFAAQQLYAPARLIEALPGVVRVPIQREEIDLIRGMPIAALPLIAWRTGDRYVTAVKLTNKSPEPRILDPRTLRGDWRAAMFQHNRLHAADSDAAGTVVYLISDRPFAEALR